MKIKHKCLAKKTFENRQDYSRDAEKNRLYILLVIGRALAYAVELKRLTID